MDDETKIKVISDLMLFSYHLKQACMRLDDLLENLWAWGKKENDKDN